MSRRDRIAYERFVDDCRFPFCWYCGREGFEVPSYWFAPFLIERAHIVNKPRREDVRAVVLLCSVCHKVAHGERVVGYERRPLDQAGMVWLKSYLDRERFDPEFLQRNSVRRVPEPFCPWYSVEEIPKVFRKLSDGRA